MIDDRLLVASLTGVPILRRSRARLFTTSYWYYRACRASVAGGSGQLSRPFAELPDDLQGRAIAALLHLPDTVQLPDPRELVPAMASLATRHQALNLLNVEAAAAAVLLDARVLLSTAGAQGVLPGVLDAEGVRWDVQEPGR